MIVDRALVAAALPGYELGAQVGQGAFGMVLAAKNRLRRDVAVKVMPGVSVRGAHAENEALMLAELDHPHVVKVHDFVPAGEMALIVMELLSGGSLRSRIDAGGAGPEWACAVALAVASALEFAHGCGLLHRDVKPENVLFAADGRLKLTDFGIAKAFQDTAAFTSTVTGTPRYMAPEQFLAGELRRTVDVYALGIVTYEVLTGKAPSGGRSNTYETLREFHLYTPPRPLDGVAPQVGQVVLRALAKEPARRQQTARQFALELASAAASALGPGWLGRAGIEVALDLEVRDAAARPKLGAAVPIRPASSRVPVRPAASIPVPPAGSSSPVPVAVPASARLVPLPPPGSPEPPRAAPDTAVPPAEAAPISGWAPAEAGPVADEAAAEAGPVAGRVPAEAGPIPDRARVPPAQDPPVDAARRPATPAGRQVPLAPPARAREPAPVVAPPGGLRPMPAPPVPGAAVGRMAPVPVERRRPAGGAGPVPPAPSTVVPPAGVPAQPPLVPSARPAVDWSRAAPPMAGLPTLATDPSAAAPPPPDLGTQSGLPTQPPGAATDRTEPPRQAASPGYAAGGPATPPPAGPSDGDRPSGTGPVHARPPAPGPATAGSEVLFLNPSQDEDYRRASRRRATTVLVGVSVLVLLAIAAAVLLG
ncbi:serine/threonine-protein kinase [Pseudofrankia inefficax]|uniref:non-specific serine/threonine protein kinase n=1 Tax=Pseudofrankia inefficax (strain DSM 45817 / CECT 9037 / DDB 130130 / EuI1c) TaxID=298654 RepID=E3JDK2_PSEI1|nr:serine/threonine-protein kinase [Pseudofrankia inefficax]ADP84768.1 serine/threonine protein kinase [Pseudofrankia inefficax]